MNSNLKCNFCKVTVMRKIITLFALVLTVLLQANAQEQWNAVKVFDFDPGTERGVYNFYIDTTDTNYSEPVFCFQTSDIDMKLIKTDFNGSILQMSPAPYIYYTIFNGDTLIFKSNSDNVTTVNGDTIASCYRSAYEHAFLAVSSMGIYVFEYARRVDDNGIINVMNNKERSFIRLPGKQISGLCCCEGVVYAIVSNNTVILKPEDLSSAETTISVNKAGLAGISVYNGVIYVYSNNDKAIYRLEPPPETAVNSVIGYTEKGEPVHYGLDGKRIDPSTPGIHIVRYPDGSVNKTIHLLTRTIP